MFDPVDGARPVGGSNMIYMGTRGMSALPEYGSVTTRVLHLCHIPVMLIH